MTDHRTDLIREAHEWFIAAELFRYASVPSCAVLLFDLRFFVIPLAVTICAIAFAVRSAMLIRRDQRAER